MISDTLSDAIDDVRTYLRDFPDVYRILRPEVSALLVQMDAVRAKLDAIPPQVEAIAAAVS